MDIISYKDMYFIEPIYIKTIDIDMDKNNLNLYKVYFENEKIFNYTKLGIRSCFNKNRKTIIVYKDHYRVEYVINTEWKYDRLLKASYKNMIGTTNKNSLLKIKMLLKDV